MSFFLDFIKGIAIGAGAILPGISSGVLCVIFEIYENLLNCILNFFKNIKQNFKILFPFASGAFVGIVLFGNILKYVFYVFPNQTNMLFILLILSSIPALIKKATNKQPFKKIYIVYMFFTFALGLLLIYVENLLHTDNSNVYEYSFIFLCFSGFLMSAGVIIPGVSSTLILMILGIYDSYLLSVSKLYVPFLFPLIIGLSIGCIVWMKIIKSLFDKYYSLTFFCIIGFTFGSLFKLILSISL